MHTETVQEIVSKKGSQTDFHSPSPTITKIYTQTNILTAEWPCRAVGAAPLQVGRFHAYLTAHIAGENKLSGI